MVDRLRSCYETEVQFYSNDPRTATIRWYFVPEGTPYLPYPTVFSSRVWDEDHLGWDGVGEVYGAIRTYDKGGSPPLVAQAGQLPCGSPQQWAQGQPNAPTTPVRLDANGNPLCCSGMPTQGNPLVWWKADAITGIASGGAVNLWPDSTGNGHDLENGDSLNAPTYFKSGHAPPLVKFAPSFNLVVYMTCNPVTWTGDFTLYCVALTPGGGNNLGWLLGNLVNPPVQGVYFDGATLQYNFGTGLSLALPDSLSGGLELWQIRVQGQDVRFQRNVRTLQENVVPGIAGPAISAMTVLADGLVRPGAVVYYGEVILLPFATNADQETYWNQYLLSKWAIHHA